MSDDPRACPWCSRENDVYDDVREHAAPVLGDVSICWSCRRLAIFTETSLRKPEDQELTVLLGDPRVADALHAASESHTPGEAVSLTRGKNADAATEGPS